MSMARLQTENVQISCVLHCLDVVVSFVAADSQREQLQLWNVQQQASMSNLLSLGPAGL